MVAHAMAQGMICALRREIARIEGIPAERLDRDELRSNRSKFIKAVDSQEMGPENVHLVCRSRHMSEEFMPTGAAGLDRVLGGGLPRAALTEIVGPATRDSAATTGFVLGLASRFMQVTSGPLLWIGASEIFREGGFPYPPGLGAGFGLAPERLLFGTVAKLADALWMAEEAAALPDIGAVLLELRGNPQRLDLTATRRLHWRARRAGRPVFLVRQGGEPEPTAAPLRLGVTAAPAVSRKTMAGALHNTIGPPAFTVVVSKWRGVPASRFIVEWNRHGFSFQERQEQDSGRVVSLAPYRKGAAPASGSVMAFPAGVASVSRSR